MCLHSATKTPVNWLKWCWWFQSPAKDAISLNCIVHYFMDRYNRCSGFLGLHCHRRKTHFPVNVFKQIDLWKCNDIKMSYYHLWFEKYRLFAILFTLNFVFYYICCIVGGAQVRRISLPFLNCNSVHMTIKSLNLELKKKEFRCCIRGQKINNEE